MYQVCSRHYPFITKTSINHGRYHRVALPQLDQLPLLLYNTLIALNYTFSGIGHPAVYLITGPLPDLSP
jgi:hypothetical protein